MKLRIFLSALALLGALAACGPADTEEAASEAAATIGALGNDPNVQAGANEAMATIEAIASDPTVEAMANEAMATMEAMANDPALMSALQQAFSSINDRVTITQGQALTFDALSSIPDVQNWTLTIVEPPSGASASKGQVVKEASGGNISLNPDEYAQYFTTSGDYRVRLDITTSDNRMASQEFTITVP